MALSRRDVLKSASLATGGVLLSPILDQIKAQAAGVSKRPPRFIFVVEGNGLPWEQITPVGVEREKNRRVWSMSRYSNATFPRH